MESCYVRINTARCLPKNKKKRLNFKYYSRAIEMLAILRNRARGKQPIF